MFKIGNIIINSPVLLAPMAGYTSEGFRDYMSNFKLGATYTEMVSDMGLIYGNKETIDYLPSKKSNIPVGVQLFGSDPENLKKATIIALNSAKHIDFFDINMGCPVPKVTKTGAGSSLLKDPKKAGEIIRAIKSVTTLPVTAKIRLGIDDKHINFLEVIEEITNAGVDAIAIHARTTKQLYSGVARYELIKDLRLKMKVPLIISGDIFSPEKAIEALNITKADAVMVARGIVGCPTLINDIYNSIERNEIVKSPKTFKTQKEQCLELAKYLIEEKGESKAMRVYRSIAPKFFGGFPEVKKLNSKLAGDLVSFKQLEQILDDYESTLDMN